LFLPIRRQFFAKCLSVQQNLTRRNWPLHHIILLIRIVLPSHFSVGDFERECLQLLDELFQKHDVVILAGGSGLYIRAITEGFDDLPTADPDIRDRLNTELAQTA
jgi:tRNA A37 N6-isopentenylltransferase MiaA